MKFQQVMAFFLTGAVALSMSTTALAADLPDNVDTTVSATQAADKQDNVPGRKRIAKKGKPRFREPDQPCNRGKQSQTHDQGKRKANGKRVPALIFR